MRLFQHHFWSYLAPSSKYFSEDDVHLRLVRAQNHCHNDFTSCKSFLLKTEVLKLGHRLLYRHINQWIYLHYAFYTANNQCY